MEQDLLGVPEENVWNYGTTLRQLALEKFPHINFVRLNHLVSLGSSEPETIEEYKQTSAFYREKLVQDHLPANFDVKTHLKQNISALVSIYFQMKCLSTSTYTADPIADNENEDDLPRLYQIP